MHVSSSYVPILIIADMMRVTTTAINRFLLSRMHVEATCRSDSIGRHLEE